MYTSTNSHFLPSPLSFLSGTYSANTLIDSKEFVSSCTMIVLLASNIEKIDKKYSNRSLRFALIESGHIAQNAMLLAAEQEIGCLEYGGFDDTIANILISEQSLISTTCLIFGEMKSQYENIVQDQTPLLALELQYPQIHSSLVSIPRSLRDYKGYFIGYVARESSLYTGFGGGTTSDEASVKAIVESVEREISMNPWVDVTSSASELVYPYFTPDQMWGYHSDVYRNTALKKLNDEDVLDWVETRSVRNNQLTYALTQMIFYGSQQQSFGYTNSNGIAAHTNMKQAFQLGFLELIERDAFVSLYHTHREVFRIDSKVWPSWLQCQSSQLRNIGYTTVVLDVTSDSIPVYLICIYSEDADPCFVCGAAAGFDFNSILLKAFSEAEAMLLTWESCSINEVMETHVSSPSDHGALYMNPKHLQSLSWLFHCPVTNEVSTKCYTWDNLIDKFDPYVVELSKMNPDSMIKVVKVLSAHLFPMYFGRGLEPINHKRVDQLEVKWVTEYPSFPHFFS